MGVQHWMIVVLIMACEYYDERIHLNEFTYSCGKTDEHCAIGTIVLPESSLISQTRRMITRLPSSTFLIHMFSWRLSNLSRLSIRTSMLFEHWIVSDRSNKPKHEKIRLFVVVLTKQSNAMQVRP